MAEYEVKPIYEFSTDEMIDELGRRSDCVVVTSLKDLGKDTEERRMEWRGSSITALGLAEYARHRLKRSLDGAASVVVDEDDDEGTEFD